MHKYRTRVHPCITRLHTSCGRIVSYFEDAPVAVRLLPKGAAALVPCDRAQFLSHFQKFHISCTKVRLRARVRACTCVCVCLCLRLCVRVCLRACVRVRAFARSFVRACRRAFS